MKKVINRHSNAAKLVTSINLALAVSVIANAPAQALQFNFVYEPGTSQDVINGFRAAGDIWSSQLNDDASVNIFIGFGQLSNTNALSGTRPAMLRVKYSDYLTQFFQDITSLDDLTAFKNLQIEDEDRTTIENLLGKTLAEANLNEINNIKPLMGDFKSNSEFRFLDEKNKTKKSKRIWLNSANAKALNLIPSHQDSFDAQIMMNNYSWDFSRVYNPTLTTSDVNKYDFLGVALHEIGHAIGIVSGIDAFTVLSAMSETNGSNSTLIQDVDYITPMDQFRYAEQSANSCLPGFSKGSNRFSIDCGTNILAHFDGINYQSSHWQAATGTNSEIGIMNPTMGKGQVLNISNLDLRLLDVIGWDRGSSFLTSNTTEGSLDDNQENTLNNTSVVDSGITRSRGGSSSTGVRFWQEKENTNYMEASEYSEMQYMEGNIENASLDMDQILAIHYGHDHGDEDYDHASVPEPNAIAGLGIFGLWGIGWLFQRRRKSTHN